MSLSKLRQSASLIIAARNKLQLMNSTSFDYRVLMVNRPDKGSFAKSFVFPGGVVETTDESEQWLKFLKNFGVPEEKLQELAVLRNPRPTIFNAINKNSINREISLRITALRETFEEVGLLFYRPSCFFQNDTKGKVSSSIYTNFDKTLWQKRVHNDASQFLMLFEELNIIPDLWCLNEWSIWISPYPKQKRFHAIFYLVGLEDVPELTLDLEELVGYSWRTPQEFLNERSKDKKLFPPPQFYELARLCNFSSLNELHTFAYNRAIKYGMNEILPVMHICSDGMLSVLPEDELYPENPFNIPVVDKTNVTIEELNSKTQRRHRIEWRNGSPQHININVKFSDGQIPPKIPLKSQL